MTQQALSKRRRNLQFLTWWVLVPLVCVVGWLVPVLGWFFPLCLFAVMGVGMFRGRWWCDWLCPRGSFLDLSLNWLSVKRKIPRFFRSWGMRGFWMVLLMGVMAWKLPLAWPSTEKMGMVFVMMLTVTTYVGVVLGTVIHPRIWCTFCPGGTMGMLVGKNKYTLKIDSEECTVCKTCEQVCPLGLAPYEFKSTGIVATDADCIKCRLCLDPCPQKALSF